MLYAAIIQYCIGFSTGLTKVGLPVIGFIICSLLNLLTDQEIVYVYRRNNNNISIVSGKLSANVLRMGYFFFQQSTFSNFSMIENDSS